MATYLLFQVLRTPFFDVNTVALTGGYIDTFVAGTTTPVATFSDNLGTSYGTRVTLDSTGRTPYGWYGDQSLSYKVRVYDLNGVEQLQYQQDNITFPDVGSSGTTVADLQRGRSTVSGATNNYDLDAIVTADQTQIDWWQWNGAANLSLTGLLGGVDGRIIRGQNITSGFLMTLVHESGSSTAANRFTTNNAASLTVNAGEIFTLAYDGTAQRWDAQVLASTAPVVGISGVVAAPSGMIAQSLTPVGNNGAGEDDLISFTLAGNLLGVNGQRLFAQFNGIAAANANNKVFRIRYGSTLAFTSGTLSLNASESWRIDVTVVRLTATTQRISSVFWTSDNSGIVSATVVTGANNTTAAETLSGTVVLKMTGEAVTTNDIVNTDAHVIWQGV